MSKLNPACFFAAGYVLGQAELGAPGPISIRDTPSMSLEDAKYMIETGAAFADLPAFVEIETAMLPVSCALSAVQQANKRGVTKLDNKYLGAAIVQMFRIERAFAAELPFDQAKKSAVDFASRVDALIAMKRHGIDRIARALSRNRSLSAADVSALLGA